jgi:hypothetical protein
MNTSKKLFYATVGVGDIAVERARKAQEKVDLSKLREFPKSLTLDRVTGQYQVLVKRGEKTFKAMKSSAPTKRKKATSN